VTVKANLFLASETDAEGVRSMPNATPGARHPFSVSADPRRTSCVKCGRPERSAVHEEPELRKAAIVSALQRAITAVQEGDEVYALSETGFVSRLLRGRVS
jgi:hypothetical protein